MNIFLHLDFDSIQNFGNKPVHVINIDIQDNHEEATIGAFLICELVTLVRILDLLNYLLFQCYTFIFTYKI